MEYIKPLRNYLRKFDLISFLKAIWYLSNHLEFRRPLPDYLRGANPYNFKSNLHLSFFLWELDTLSREVILHCEPFFGQKITEWNQIAIALNRLKKAEQDALEVDEYSVFSELSRIAHRQFHWQQGITYNDLIRTRKIYRSDGMNSVVRHVYGMSTEQVALSGFSALATYLEHFAITNEWAGNAEKVIGHSPLALITNLTADLMDIRKMTHDVRRLDSNWAYAFNPLWLYPLIRIDDGKRIICPMPGLLARRITEGLYFDIAGHNVDVLSEHMGPAFQAYVGEVLNRTNSGQFKIQAEKTYGTKKKPKDTVDWIVEDASASLFIEVKILKMARAAKEYLAPYAAVTTELKKLAKAAGQLYSTLTDALAGRYPHWEPNEKPIHPLIVTLDNWNLFTHNAFGELQNLIGDELDRRGIARSIIKDHQYVVCCSSELEFAIQVMAQTGIHEVMKGLTSGDKIGWLFSGHLRSEFSKQFANVKPLFPEERDNFLPR